MTVEVKYVCGTADPKEVLYSSLTKKVSNVLVSKRAAKLYNFQQLYLLHRLSTFKAINFAEP